MFGLSWQEDEIPLPVRWQEDETGYLHDLCMEDSKPVLSIQDYDVILKEQRETTPATYHFKNCVRSLCPKSKTQDLSRVVAMQMTTYDWGAHPRPTFFIKKKKAEVNDAKESNPKYIDDNNKDDNYFWGEDDGPYIRVNRNCMLKELQNNGGTSLDQRKKRYKSSVDSVPSQPKFDLQCLETLDKDAKEIIDSWISGTSQTGLQIPFKEWLASKFWKDLKTYRNLIENNKLEANPLHAYDHHRQENHKQLIVNIANTLGNAMLSWYTKESLEGTHSVTNSSDSSTGSGQSDNESSGGHGSSRGSAPGRAEGRFNPSMGGSDSSRSSSPHDSVGNSDASDSGGEDSDSESDSGGNDGYGGAVTLRTSTTSTITSISSDSKVGDTQSSDDCNPDDKRDAEECFSSVTGDGGTVAPAEALSDDGDFSDGAEHTDKIFLSESAGGDADSSWQLLSCDGCDPDVEEDTIGFFWFWCGGDGEFLPFDDSIMLMLEKARQGGEDHISVPIGNNFFIINLKNLEQTNARSGYSRPICKTTALWHWKDDDGQTWRRYNREDSLQLAMADLSVLNESVLLFHESATYDIDLDRRVQHNIVTGREREICSGLPHPTAVHVPSATVKAVSGEDRVSSTRTLVASEDGSSMATLQPAATDTSIPFAKACVVKPSDAPSTNYTAPLPDLGVDDMIDDLKDMTLARGDKVFENAGTENSLVPSEDSPACKLKQ